MCFPKRQEGNHILWKPPRGSGNYIWRPCALSNTMEWGRGRLCFIVRTQLSFTKNGPCGYKADTCVRNQRVPFALYLSAPAPPCTSYHKDSPEVPSQNIPSVACGRGNSSFPPMLISVISAWWDSQRSSWKQIPTQYNWPV